MSSRLAQNPNVVSKSRWFCLRDVRAGIPGRSTKFKVMEKRRHQRDDTEDTAGGDPTIVPVVLRVLYDQYSDAIRASEREILSPRNLSVEFVRHFETARMLLLEDQAL